MAQAKRKKSSLRKKKPLAFSFTGHGLGMLLSGIVIGVVGTILWQGLKSGNSDIGSGIRQMIEQSRQKTAADPEPTPQPSLSEEPQSTNYDFFTVLPEIEVVVNGNEESAAAATIPVQQARQSSSKTEASEPVVAEVVKPKNAYMLQSGSYNRQTDAERQKANLALLGLRSTIQKITIQDRGDFYRVRMGPFADYGTMVLADERLKEEGIEALRLKISGGG